MYMWYKYNNKFKYQVLVGWHWGGKPLHSDWHPWVWRQTHRGGEDYWKSCWGSKFSLNSSVLYFMESILRESHPSHPYMSWIESFFRLCGTRSNTSMCLWSLSSKRTRGWPTLFGPWSPSSRRCLVMASGTMQSLRCNVKLLIKVDYDGKRLGNIQVNVFRQPFGLTATMLLSGETSRFQRSRRPGGRGSSTGSCSRSSAWRGTCRRSSSTPTTRRRTPRSSKPSMKTRTSCSSKRYISWNTSISSHHLTPFSRFANSSKPFACKDIKIALTEIMELSNTLEEAKEKVPSFWRLSWADLHDRLTNRQTNKQTNKQTKGIQI